jgi:hypothetical protein
LATPNWRRCTLPTFLPDREPMKPHRRISRVMGTNDRDAEIGDRKQASPNRVGVPWTGVDVRALDEEKRKHRRVSDSTDLRPEPTAAERAVEIRHGLSLDQHTPRDAVVACGQRLDHDPGSKSLKARGDAASILEDVRNDRRSRHLVHGCSLDGQQDVTRNPRWHVP